MTKTEPTFPSLKLLLAPSLTPCVFACTSEIAARTTLAPLFPSALLLLQLISKAANFLVDLASSFLGRRPPHSRVIAHQQISFLFVAQPKLSTVQYEDLSGIQRPISQIFNACLTSHHSVTMACHLKQTN